MVEALTTEQVTLLNMIARSGYVPSWAGAPEDWQALEDTGFVHPAEVQCYCSSIFSWVENAYVLNEDVNCDRHYH